MGKIFYTSDLHLGHLNIILYENRPFTSIKDMEINLIERWNYVVDNSDDVYVLGDFALISSKYTIEDVNNVVKRLHGKKHLIIGNHDQWIKKKDVMPNLWEEITYYKEIRDNGKDVILMHYPIEEWNKQRYGAIHLHGHLHSTPTILYQKQRYNVGCDNWNYYPVTLETILREGKLS